VGLAILLSLVCVRPPSAVVHVHAVRAVWPARGIVTSPYGRDGFRWHPGLDIGVLRSLAVRAAVPGRVVAVGEPRGYEGYGKLVVVRSRGYTELYAHLARWKVRRGERVRAGERIATAGCTGVCWGTHLHFEVRREGRAVSPWRLLRHATMRP
jgi:murein DD-endopeptidase MepM/ murein hydrolase activator NlpD